MPDSNIAKQIRETLFDQGFIRAGAHWHDVQDVIEESLKPSGNQPKERGDASAEQRLAEANLRLAARYNVEQALQAAEARESALLEVLAACEEQALKDIPSAIGFTQGTLGILAQPV